MNYYKLCFFSVFLLIVGCDVSNISDEELKDLSNIKANIYIQDHNKGDCLDELKVYITDGKKQIINNQVKILVNEVPLELHVKQDLYYTKKSYYSKYNFARSESYYFQVILPDSTIHPLAYVKPQSNNDSLRFVISKTASRSNDLVLNWDNINLPAELTIWKGIQNKETKGYSGGEYAETTINEVVSSKTGEYVIHRSFFEDSLNIATYVKVSLNHREFGLINPSLLVGSDVIYDSKLEGTIDLVE